ncbi:MAG: hypothetical protein COT81_03630 [Candidatus Buchananbacteria bacterium CG10_big_fil_rev_8_21_14_0_10_42_9]|uniref:CBM-cenC domain-containing protein n=1 Tax=Candidatus Buchananbacteria bacterium CG10_big_fil_rev_8_21_14_0_10_42_9 TaxID=1974526 RepID=A0A2H0W0P6_9BACT|nr:MAG: hypothetical protein COT81_03630 [Candidatus Buchananbacteria bacterium CG10_big_fil_rev_8_21_14_0_10_42_9]
MKSFLVKNFFICLATFLLLSSLIAPLNQSLAADVPGADGSGVASVSDPAVNTVSPDVTTRDAGEEARRVAAEEKKEQLKRAAAIAFKQALNFFLQNLAHDSAVAIVSGGEGQTSLFYEQSFGDYVLGQLDRSAGIFAETLLGDGFGINYAGLCDPGIPFRLSLTLGLPGFEPPSPPSCTLTELAGNWRSRLGSADFADFFVASLDPRANQLGIGGEIQKNYLGELIAKAFVSSGERSDGDFEDIVDKITGEILTPGDLLRRQAEEGLIVRPANIQEARTGDIVADAIDTFVQTLAGEMFKKLFEGLRSFSGSRGSRPAVNVRLPGSSVSSQISGLQAARDRFASIFEVGRRVGGPQEILVELSQCNNINNPGPNNCVIDQKFRQAVENELTVQQAINQDLLDPNAPFGFISGGFEPPYNQGLPYRSILVLRTHRIVPASWELAAQYIGVNGDEQKLGDLVDAFNDVNSPYFGLVDPNWVLKAPEAFCALEGFSNYLNDDKVTGSGSSSQRVVTRAEYCADQQSCLEEDIDGSCKTYGYCTKEKPTWDFQANRCSEDFATCETFRGTSGNVTTASYLKNTLDFEGCSVDSVGCQWYCTEYNPFNGVWTCTEEQEKVLRECNNPNGCSASVSCFVPQGEQACQSDEGAFLFLRNPCSATSPGWDAASQSCFRSESCTIEPGGVQCIVPSCSDLPNQVANGSFETSHPTPLINNDPAASWVRVGNNLPFSLTRVTGSNEKVFSGNFSLRFFTNGGVTQAGNSQLILQNEANTLTGLTAGNTYTASIWVYNSLQLGNVFLQVSSGSAGCNTQGFVPQKGTWQQIACNFDAGANTATIQIYATDNPVGTFWLDEATITQECLNEQATVTLIGQSDLDGSKIYFDDDVQTCSASEAGCSNLLRLNQNFGRNLIAINSSFEEVGTGWPIAGSTNQSHIGNQSVELAPGQSVTYAGPPSRQAITPGVPYIYSAWGLGENSSGQTGQLTITEFAGGSQINSQSQNLNLPSSWRQFNMLYTPSQNFCQNGVCSVGGNACPGGDNDCPLVSEVELSLGNNSTNGQVWYDDVTFGDISDFTVNGSIQNAQVANAGGDFGIVLDNLHIKQPPSYLGCTGDPESDPLECGSYAGVCSADEVGCDLFSPTNGDIPIPGIPAEGDYCPSECVGYAAFKQSATNYENEQFPVYLIPDRGDQCNAAAVGCQEFTNLDEVARGGEGLEYYTFLRQCVKPENAVSAGNSCGTFFTWVGSDVTGFQLQVHNLQLSNDPATECDPTVSVCPAQVNLASNFGRCENLQDAINNPFCKEFIAPNGDKSYIIIEQTISCTDNCVPYRATDVDLGINDCQAFGGVEEDIDNDGTVDACVFNAVPGEGQSCGVAEAGCREYRGNAAPNVFNVFTDTFEFNAANQWHVGDISSESTNVGGHSLASASELDPTITSAQTLSGSTNSAGYVDADGSGTCTEADGSYNDATRTCLAQMRNGETCEILLGDTFCGILDDRLVNNGNYLLSFWAKNASQNPSNANFDVAIFNQIQIATDIGVGPNWQNYLLGPFTIGDVSPEAILSFRRDCGANCTAADTFYIDNVVLKQVQDFEYLIKDSWDIPLSCDSNPALDPNTYPQPNAPQFMLGCQEYTDRFGQLQYLKSFDQLCRASAAGCEAFIDTHNSNSSLAEQFNLGDPLAQVNVPSDNLTYLVNDPNFYCPSTSQGCTELGLPEINGQTGKVSDYETVYLIQDPETFGTTLCESEALGCEAWQSGNGLSYFKAPGDRTCEFAAKGADSIPRWYKSGTNEACPVGNTPLGVLRPDRACIGGFNDGQQCRTDEDCLGPNDNSSNDDGNCQNWAGLCSARDNSCTEFVDPGSSNRENQIFNGGFDQDVLGDLTNGVDNWSGPVSLPSGQPVFTNDGKFGLVGAKSILSQIGNPAFQYNSGQAIHQDLILGRSTLYTVGFEAAVPPGSSVPTSGNLRATLACADPTGDQKLQSFDNSMLVSDNVTFNGSLYDVAELSVPANVITKSDLFNIETGGFTTFSGRVFIDEQNNGCRVYFGSDESINLSSVPIIFEDVFVKETGVYYHLKNDADYQSCNGIVNAEEGCVLFNDRSEVNYSIGESDSSYLIFNSHQTDNGETASSSCAAGNCNSNSIVKVKPDRECAEWLDCSSRTKVVGLDGIEQDVCVDLVTCRSFDANGECDDFVTPSSELVANNLTPLNQTFAYRDVSRLRNLSGYSTPGYRFDSTGSFAIEGQYQYSLMPQVGEVAEVPNPSFEIFTADSEPLGWSFPDFSRVWTSNLFNVIADPVTAETEGITQQDGNAILRFGSNFGVISDSFDVFANTEYVLSALINTRQLDVGEASGNSNIATRIEVVIDDGGRTNVISGSTIEQPAGLGWRQRLVSFSTPSNVTKVRIRMYNTDGSAECEGGFDDPDCFIEGKTFVDLVKLRPALEVQSINQSPVLVGNSCRVYPESDSLSCEYTGDEGITYQGINGYCLLEDPRNPNLCLQWWPVNMIKGDQRDLVAGYNDRFPLYQCLANDLTLTEKIEDTGIITVAEACVGGYFPTFTPDCVLFRHEDAQPLNSKGNGAPRTLDAAGISESEKDFASLGLLERVRLDVTFPGGLTACAGNFVGNLIPFSEQSPTGRTVRTFDVMNSSYEYTDPAFVWGLSVGGDTYCSAYVGFFEETAQNHSRGDLAFIQACAIDQGSCSTRDSHRFNLQFDGFTGFDNLECRAFSQTVTRAGSNKAWNARVDKGSDFELHDTLTIYSSDSAPFGAAQPPDPINRPELWDNSTADGLQPLGVENPDASFAPPYQARSGSVFACIGSTPETDQKTFTDDFISQLPSGGAVYTCNGGINDGITCDPSLSLACTASECTGDPDFNGNACHNDSECGLGTCVDPNPSDNGTCVQTSGSSGGSTCGLVGRCSVSGSVCVQYPYFNRPTIGFCSSDDPQTSGLECQSDADCGFGVCQTNVRGAGLYLSGGCPVEGEVCDLLNYTDDGGPEDDPSGNPIPFDIRQDNAIAKGADRVKRLFARAFGIWELNTVGYERQNPISRVADDFNGDGISDLWDPPVSGQECPDNIRPLAVCSNSGVPCTTNAICGPGGSCQNISVDYCAVAPIVSRISIAGEIDFGASKQVQISEAGSVSLEFNTQVDANQEPIAAYRIDWGDGRTISVSGLKSIQDRSNQDEPIKLSHSYNYFDILARSASSQSIYCAGDSHPTLGTVPANTCYIQPRIQVIDNWGWCNANIDHRENVPTSGQPIDVQTGGLTNTWGYYGTACQGGLNSFQSYNGTIIVTRN